jgi:Zn-dependent peptidase ImmA (M78 family)
MATLSRYGLGLSDKKGARRAMTLLYKWAIDRVEDIDLEKLCMAEHALVQTKPISVAQGRIVFGANGRSVITINSGVSHRGKRRFVLAHELGHHLMHRNKQRLFYSCDVEALMKWKGSDQDEIDANTFAAELLMPSKWIKKTYSGQEPNVALIKDMAAAYRVSYTAALIRFVKLNLWPSAVVYSASGYIQWAMFSEDFPVQYVPFNTRVPQGTQAADLFISQQRSEEVAPTIITDWFGLVPQGVHHRWIKEQSTYFKGHDTCLSLLWTN